MKFRDIPMNSVIKNSRDTYYKKISDTHILKIDTNNVYPTNNNNEFTVVDIDYIDNNTTATVTHKKQNNINGFTQKVFNDYKKTTNFYYKVIIKNINNFTNIDNNNYISVKSKNKLNIGDTVIAINNAGIFIIVEICNENIFDDKEFYTATVISNNISQNIDKKITEEIENLLFEQDIYIQMDEAILLAKVKKDLEELSTHNPKIRVLEKMYNNKTKKVFIKEYIKRNENENS